VVSARALTIFLAVLAVVGLLTYGLLSKGSAGVDVGSAAPTEPLPRLGEPGEASLADYRGRWVLVNFWASWCVPCRTESPDLQAFQRRYGGDGFTVLGIDTQDLSRDALAFIEEFGLTYPHLRDGDGDAAEDWGTTGVPESYLVDPKGKLRVLRRGPVDSAYLEEFIAPLITGGAEA